MALLQMMILSQQNLLDACNDIARCFTLLHRESADKAAVIIKIGAANIAAQVATDRLAVVIEAMKNPESLT